LSAHDRSNLAPVSKRGRAEESVPAHPRFVPAAGFRSIPNPKGFQSLGHKCGERAQVFQRCREFDDTKRGLLASNPVEEPRMTLQIALLVFAIYAASAAFVVYLAAL
jgi:hypothetical protein